MSVGARSGSQAGAASTAMTGGDALAQQLVREGVRDVFGIPGVQLDWAVDGLAKVADRLTFRTTRHEQAAAYMADGYARTTGEAGVCLVVPGPGVLNAMAGLATAFACSSPVVCLAGQIPSAAIGRGLGLLHEIRDQSATLATVTKWQAMARRPEEIPALLHEAFRQVRSGRPQPVVIEVPPDVFQASAAIDLIDAPPDGGTRIRPDPRALSDAAALLERAEFPVIYAGWGVQAAGASAELARLADALQAPVVMSDHGRGALSDRHPLALTSLGGRAVLPHADVVLAVGSRFVTTGGRPVHMRPGARLVLLNADPADLGPPRVPDAALEGDAKQGLAALADLIGRSARSPRHDDVGRVRSWCEAQMRRVEPQWSWVQALRAGIPEDGILVSELTQVGYLANVAYPVYGPRTFVTPGYQGTLGYGFATGLGAVAGNPGRAVVSIAGDGGFGWSLQELATARKYALPLVVVVFNDNAFGNVKRSQKVRFGGRVLGTDLANPDFVRLAEAFGVQAARAVAPDELEGALRAALAARAPALIEVPVGEMDTAWHLIHEFVEPPEPAPPNPLGEPARGPDPSGAGNST